MYCYIWWISRGRTPTWLPPGCSRRGPSWSLSLISTETVGCGPRPRHSSRVREDKVSGLRVWVGWSCPNPPRSLVGTVGRRVTHTPFG